MLYYVEDKLLRTPFVRLWAAIEKLVGLARPGSREIQAVTIWDERKAKAKEVSAWSDGSVQSQDQVRALAGQARFRIQHPFFRVYLRWHPQFGPTAVDYLTFPGNPQLSLYQQTATSTWAALMIPTSFVEVDYKFIQFLKQAHSILPFRLLTHRWRRVVATKRGSSVLRKVVFPDRA